MDIEKAKEVLNRINNAKRFDGIYTTIDIIFEAIEVLLNELDNKDNIINEMAIDLEYINAEILDEYDKIPYAESKQKIIDYFTKKVEGK